MLKQKNNKILLYGGKSTAYIVNSMLKNTKLEPSYIFDQYLKSLFSSKAKFSNKKIDLKILLKNQKSFVCIGMMDGKLRDYISNLLIKKI